MHVLRINEIFTSDETRHRNIQQRSVERFRLPSVDIDYDKAPKVKVCDGYLASNRNIWIL